LSTLSFANPLAPLQTVLAGLLLLRPAVITNPVIKIWQIGSTLMGRARATTEVMSAGGSVA
jgi:hypothetical protein